MITLYLLIGLFAGIFLQSLLVHFIKNHKKNKNIRHINLQFETILDKIINKKSRFRTRVNNVAYISVVLPDYGKVDLVFFIDKNDIAIFNSNSNEIIFSSTDVRRDTIDSIITAIYERHGFRINDVVDLLGVIIYRPDFEASFNITIDELKKAQDKVKDILSQEQQEGGIDKIVEQNEKKFNIDEILDKIGKYGMDKLTQEEKDFLAKYR